MRGIREREQAFKPGDIVIVKHDLFQDSVISIIQETDDNYIYLAYPHEFKGSGIKAGDRLECHVRCRNYEYLINCRINNINSFYPMYLHLNIDNISEYQCRRSSSRYLADYITYCTIPGSGDNMEVNLKNISKTGILISIAKKNPKNFENISQVQMKLVTDKNETVCFGAKVVWTASKGNFNEFGMQIINIDQNNHETLVRILNRLEDELGSLVLSYIMSGSISENNSKLKG